MPVELTIRANTEPMERFLAGMIRRTKNPRGALEIIAETGLASIQRNFEVGGRPGWRALAEATLKRKRRRGKILIQEKRLLGGIHYKLLSVFAALFFP